MRRGYTELLRAASVGADTGYIRDDDPFLKIALERGHIKIEQSGLLGFTKLAITEEGALLLRRYGPWAERRDLILMFLGISTFIWVPAALWVLNGARPLGSSAGGPVMLFVIAVMCACFAAVENAPDRKGPPSTTQPVDE